MFKLNDIKELIRAVDKSTIDELIVKGENKDQLTIRKNTATAAQQATAQAVPPTPIVVESQAPVQATKVETEAPKEKQEEQVQDNLHKITSPMVGTFYSAPSPDADAYVKVGDRVKADTVVCIVEAMKLMNELEAEVSGEIMEILVENGQLVEYGQALFLVKQA